MIPAKNIIAWGNVVPWVIGGPSIGIRSFTAHWSSSLSMTPCVTQCRVGVELPLTPPQSDSARALISCGRARCTPWNALGYDLNGPMV